MQSNFWDRVVELFLRVTDLSPEERGLLLDRECRKQPELRQEVELLVKYDRPESVSRVLTNCPDLSNDILSKMLTFDVERYRLIEIIGKGGEGVVFKARQEEGVDRDVALKFLLTSMGDRRRFIRQTRVFASIHHPNVATLFDGGITESGLPYLVMELIAGIPITDYCDAKGFNGQAWLGLFLTVCNAVQFIHEHSVVHRDLKPDNLLVSSDGTVKILDFGLSQFLDVGTVSSVTSNASRDPMMLTPSYAAPEQLKGDPIRTTTDIYALGLLLYEILTGKNPQRLDSETDLESIRKFVVDVTYPHPSSVAESTELRNFCRGDLDSIVMKAIEKTPDARYRTVVELSRDISNFLSGQAVEARKPLDWQSAPTGETLKWRVYLGWKLLRRRWLALSTCILLVTVLLGFALHARQQAEETALERDTAEQVEDFLIEIFQVTDPSESRGKSVTAKEILDQAVARLEKNQPSQPRTQGRLRAAIGMVFRNLGLLHEARTQLEKSLELRRLAFPELHIDVADGLNGLAIVQNDLGMYDLAQSNFEEAISTLRELNNPRPRLMANLISQLAALHSTLGDNDKTRVLLEESTAIYEKLGDSQGIADGAVFLGNLYWETSELELAEAQYRRALTLRQELGRDSPKYAQVLNNLGDLRRRLGDLQEAESLLTEAVEVRRRVLGDRHHNLGNSLNNLALVYYAKGDFETSSRLLAETEQIFEQAFGEDDDRLATVRGSLAAVRLQSGLVNEAEMTFRSVLRVHRLRLGERHPSVARDLNNIAICQMYKGRLGEALELLENALEIYEESFGKENLQVATSLNGMAVVLLELGDSKRSIDIGRRALAIRESALGADHALVGTSLLNLGQALLADGKPEAETVLKRSVETLSTALGDGHREVATARSSLGGALMELNRLDQAGDLILGPIPTIERAYPDFSHQKRRALARAVAYWEKLGDDIKAQFYRERIRSVTAR